MRKPCQRHKFVINFLEYEFDLERGDIFTTLDESSCVFLIRSQQGANDKGMPTSQKPSFISKNSNSSSHVFENTPKSLGYQPRDSNTYLLEIFQICKSSKIQIPPTKYLKLNPIELDRLIKYVKLEKTTTHFCDDQLVNVEASTSSL